MTLRDTSLRDVKILQPARHGDARGWFAEFYNADTFAFARSSLDLCPGQSVVFPARGVLRGLHFYQLGHPQGKLIPRPLRPHLGRRRRSSSGLAPTSDAGPRSTSKPSNDEGELELLWIPEGFAHGFLVLSETAEVLYKTTRGYYPPGERCLLWNDAELSIPWPLDQLSGIEVSVSAKDAKGALLRDAELP